MPLFLVVFGIGTWIGSRISDPFKEPQIDNGVNVTKIAINVSLIALATIATIKAVSTAKGSIK